MVCCCAWVLYIDKSSPLLCSFLFFSFLSAFSLSLSSLFTLSLSLSFVRYFCCLSSSVSRFHQYPSTTSSSSSSSSSLSALNICPSVPLSSSLSLSLPHFLSLSVFRSHPFSLSLSLTMTPTSFTPLLSPLSSPPPNPLLSRPHSHVDLLGGGPRRDRRGGGCYRLHPALPPHCPRQIPHQTQRSTAHTLTHTNGHAHACMMSVQRDTLA